MKKSKRSIVTSIVVFNTIIVLIGVITTCVFFYLKSKELSRQINQQEISARIEVIRNAYAEILFNREVSKINEISKAFFVSKKGLLLALRVLDREGTVLVDINAENNDPDFSFEEASNSPDVEKHIVPILKLGEKIGSVEFVTSATNLMLYFKELLFYSVSVFVYVFLLISVLFYLFLSKHLSQPLRHMAEEAGRIQFGDYGLHLSENFYGELGEVSAALNTAVAQINLRDRKLVSYSENLKKMVELQSIELNEQKAVSINASRMATIGEISAVIAHEVNNPLTIIEVQVFKLSKMLKEMNQKSEDFKFHKTEINKILEMTSRISRIVKSLNVISRDGRCDPFKPFDLIAMLENIQLLTEFRVKSMGAELKIEYPEEIPVCFGREVQISQVLLNLINNSIDAIVTLPEKKILVQVLDDKNRVVFKVTDSGGGIPEELASKIMQPFFTTKSIGKGTGLGLGIVSSIIQDHHGDFFYNSQSPNTQFIFSLPKIKNS